MKIIVCHPAQQHSYRLATALKRAGMLSAYITTVYYKKGSLTVFASKMLKGKFQKKAMGRCCSELSDSDVIQFCEGEGLLKLLALNVPQFRPFYYKLKYNTADRFARKVAKYAIKSKADVVITYDDCSPLLFEILKEKTPNVIRILDMSAANLHYMRQIYDKDTELMPEFANRLHQEYAKVWNDEIMEKCLREIRASQYFLTPSSFVRKSLRYSGVEESQMLDCPYGVDISEFFSKMYTKTTDKKPMKFVYVGGVKELKGISYLLEAFMEIPEEQAELTVVGNFNPNDTDIKKYLERVRFTGMVLHSEIPDLLRASDVFVFPSLGEGLSLSTLEAAACGLPLIVSENSGVNDYIKEGEEGFVIPIQSVDSIVEKVDWFCKHRDKIEEMGNKARRMAVQFTWDKYYEQAVRSIEEVVGNERKSDSAGGQHNARIRQQKN